MKINVKITELNHDDLVTLFSAALYGNPAFNVNYTEEERNAVMLPDDCYEDIIARMLLAGMAIHVEDIYADDDEKYREDATWNPERETMVYDIDYNDVIEGLALAAINGEMERVNRLATDDFAFDMIDADILLQYITFGEHIYG